MMWNNRPRLARLETAVAAVPHKTSTILNWPSDFLTVPGACQETHAEPRSKLEAGKRVGGRRGQSSRQPAGDPGFAMRIEQERFNPKQFVPPWVRHQHLERYRWAARMVGGRRVLDAACGTGYGTMLLAGAGASSVLGVDCSPAAVAGAMRGCGRPNVGFAVAAADRLPVPDGSYDVYVSYETIEHVEDDEGLLAEAARVLDPGGLFLVSTPNRGLLDPGISMDQKPFNKFHVREYKRDELEERLGRYFQSVEWFGQSAYARSYVASLDWLGRFCPSLAVRFHQARKCLHWPWESSQCHLPRAWSDGSILPEILIAVCRSPRPGLQRRDGRQ